MKTRNLSLGLAALLALGIATTAAAAGSVKLAALPFTFDPLDLGNVGAKWMPHEGLAESGVGDHALLLYKDTATAEYSAAGAFITGVEGLTVDGDTDGTYDFGFDVRADSHASGGAPRFNLETTDGFHFIGGAGNGDVVDSTLDNQGRIWHRIRIDAQDPGQCFPVVPGGAEILSLTLVVDEGTDVPVAGAGFYAVDNLMVDPLGSGPVLIGKPGKNEAE